MNEETIRLRIDLAYDGTAFSGWAKQPGLRTVQGELEHALALLLRRENNDVALTVGGRTDAGVHARGQVCHVDITTRELERISGRGTRPSERKLNGILRKIGAQDIAVHNVARVPMAFDARFSAISRRYEYRVRPLDVRLDPLERHTVVDLKHDVDFSLLQEASASLVGLRDFAAFCKAREGATTIRTLLEFTWQSQPNGVLAARISADAFCHSMVRSLIGGVTAVASGRIRPDELDQLAVGKQRSSRIPVMPPHGLSLEEITYPEDTLLAARSEQTRARRTAPGKVI